MRRGGRSRTLLPTMTHPMELPGPGNGAAHAMSRFRAFAPALVAALAVICGAALVGVAAGFLWAAVSPRAVLEVTAPGQASLVQAETSAYIAADGLFVIIALVGGAVIGLLGYLLAVRRHGPLPMAGVVLGALAAAFVARTIGEQSHLATFHHLLATLPPGARLRDSLRLGAGSALALWPLAAGLVAGGMTALSARGSHRA